MKIDPDEVQRLLDCIKFDSPKLVIEDPADTIVALCTYFFETESRVRELEEWQQAVFEIHPNIDLDLETM